MLKLNNNFTSSIDPMDNKKTFCKVDWKLIVDDPSLGILEWNTAIKKRQPGPTINYLSENAEKISQQDIVTTYKTAIDILDLLNDDQHLLAREVIQNSKQTLYPKTTELRFLDDIERYSEEDRKTIMKALSIAKKVHVLHKRDEWWPYISHCIAVARKAIEEWGDVNDIVVCLLHDAYEDYKGNREVFYQQIYEIFNEDIANSIVKLSKWRWEQKIDDQEYLNELSHDLKNLKRKGYDRINNLESLRFTNNKKRNTYLHETIEKYIPLFEKSFPSIAKKMKWIIKLYKENQLWLTGQEKNTLEQFKVQ